MNIKKSSKFQLAIISVLATIFALPFLAHAGIIYDGTQVGGVTNNDAFQIDFDQSSVGNIDLQFGTSTRYLRWNGTKFQVSNDLDLNSNQITSARLENVTALPGGAGGLGAGGIGRVVQLTVIDAIAPGCISPSCSPGAYSWTGSVWATLQGSVSASTASKIVTVGPTGRDYTSIAAAATYLNTLSGGEMWIDPGNFPITAVVDLANIRVKGADSALTVIDISGGGKILVKDTKFEDAKINVGAITAVMGLDVKFVASSSSSVDFDRMNFSVNAGKVLLDSTAGTPPVTIATFQNSSQTLVPAGTIVRSLATTGLNNTLSTFTVIDLLSSNALMMVDWPVVIIGGSNVVTSGTINSVPDRTILVSPGMNIQGAINSLGASGGVIKLLIGTHNVTNSVLVNNDNIKLTGEGPGTVLRAATAGWVGGVTADDCLIQVGNSDGTTPRRNVTIDSFQLQVGPNIHGLCVNGGTEDKVFDMVVQSIGPKTLTRTAIVFTDAAASAGARFTATRSIINSDTGANNWVDGVHFDGNNSIPGQLFGYNNGISDSIISEMIVNQAQETAYAFSQVSASAVFSNRARGSSISPNSFGMYFTNGQDIAVINNTLEGATAATATGISFANDVDNSIIIGNVVRGGPTAFNIGINIATATSSGNTVAENQVSTTTTKLNNAGVATRLGTSHINSTVNPTALDDSSFGYDVGTMWINTANQTVFVNVVNTVGAAIWRPVNNETGTDSNTFTLDQDLTGGNSTLQFGAAESLTWDSANTRFNLSDDLNIVGGGLTQDGNTIILDNDNTGGDMALQFGQSLNKTLRWDSANAHFVFNDDVDITGAIGFQNGDFAGPLLGGAVNNLALPNTTFVRVTTSTLPFNITGITGGYDGRYLILVNTTGVNMSINNQNGGSTAANRIITNTGGTLTTAGTGIAILIYDAASTRWRVIAFTA